MYYNWRSDNINMPPPLFSLARSQCLRIPLIEILRGFLPCDQRPAPDRAGSGTYICLSSLLLSSAGRAKNDRQTVADTGSALMKLRFEVREALVLSAAGGFLDLDIAGICGCKQEIVRARILRGRTRLAELLGIEFDNDLDPVTIRTAPLVAADMQDRAAA